MLMAFNNGRINQVLQRIARGDLRQPPTGVVTVLNAARAQTPGWQPDAAEFGVRIIQQNKPAGELTLPVAIWEFTCRSE
jgi:hypothetical protein